MTIAPINNGESGSSVRNKINSVISAVNSSREVLTAARTYYVRTDGSDSNNGLSNTAGGAFRTWGRALAEVAKLDCGDQVVTLQGNGSFTETVVIDQSFVGLRALVLSGNTSTPSSCAIAAASGAAVRVATTTTTVRLSGLRLGGGSTEIALDVSDGTAEITGNCEFASTSSVHAASAGTSSTLSIKSSYAVVGDATSIHLAAYDGALISANNPTTITITASGTRNTGNWLVAERCAEILLVNLTWSGTFTGGRYVVGPLSLIFRVNVTGTPGNTGGSVDALGKYV